MSIITRMTTLAMPAVFALTVGLGCSSEGPLDSAITNPSAAAGAVVPVPLDPWEQAEFEQITSGPSFDMLGRRAMGIDDEGTLHVIYQRGVLAEQTLYYVSRPQGGNWSEPEIVGAPGTTPGPGWLEVRKETGEAYVAFYQPEGLTLGIRRAGCWEFHTLEVPPEYGVSRPAVAIDAAGLAHVAMVINYDGPGGVVILKMAYGYWDGSPDFHFQVLEGSYVPHYALFACPDIVARSDGSVAIAYHHGESGQYLIRVEDNTELGGTEWNAEIVDVKNVIVYPQSLEIDKYGYLHLAFHTNIELGATHRAYYAVRRDQHFGRTQEVSGAFTGARPRIAFGPDDRVHLVFEETIGAQASGRLIHAYKDRGKWVQTVIADNQAVNPSFVMDKQGNGSIIFERRVILMEDHDIEYFGFVAPLQ